MHTGLPSPSTAMFKNGSFIRGLNHNHRQSMKNSIAVASSTTEGRVPMGKKTAQTSSYLHRLRTTNKNAQFWGDLQKMAEKAGRIDTVDNRFNPLNPTGPATSLDTRPRNHVVAPNAVRGQSSIYMMHAVKPGRLGGEEQHERNHEGRSMNAILQPDSAPQRRCMTPRVNNFSKSSQQIGTTLQRHE